MAKRGPKNYTDAQIIKFLREVEALQAQGHTVVDAVQEQGISAQTYYRWKKSYGSMNIDQLKKFKQVEKENARLKKLLAEANLDNDILREALEGKY